MCVCMCVTHLTSGHSSQAGYVFAKIIMIVVMKVNDTLDKHTRRD